jgi:hypothetical protein
MEKIKKLKKFRNIGVILIVIDIIAFAGDDKVLKVAVLDPEDLETFEFIKKKLDINDEEFQKIMNAPINTYKDFKTYDTYIKKLKYPLKIAASLNIIPKILYEKYAKE